MRARFPRALWVGLGLLLLVAAIYGRTRGFRFLEYDDPDYFSDNPMVRAGLGWAGIRWAFTTFWAANWHPLTWLSLMADVTLFGYRPGPPHLVNAALHAANAVLVFLLLRAATGSFWRSAMVAALFAVHPQRVESVAWITERKDLLSAGFALLSLLAYQRYARGPARNRVAYGLSLLAFALALLAKPMPVTLPVLMLLLDRWPLGRLPSLSWPRLRPLLAEKAPFFLLAAASSVVTVIAQRQGGAVVTLADLPMAERLCNAQLAYLRYLALGCWPWPLGPFYGIPSRALLLKVAAPAFLALAGATWAAIAQRGRRPWLLVGWLWFLAALLPVIGILQVGGQALADRYTYLPMLGPALILVWGGNELAGRVGLPVPLRALACGLALAALGAVSWVQVGYWRDSETLFTHANRVEPRNAVVLLNLGLAQIRQDRMKEALPYLEEAVRLKPAFPLPRGVLAETYYCLGDYPKALDSFAWLLKLSPENPSGLLRAGELLARAGRLEESVTCYRAFLKGEPKRMGSTLKPAWEKATGQKARFTLALIVARLGWHKEACSLLAEALRRDPGNPMYLLNLGIELEAAGRWPEAIAPLRQCALAAPRAVEPHLRFGLALSRTGQPAEARAELSRVLALQPGNAEAAAALKDLAR